MDLTTGALWLGRLLMAGYAVLVFIEMLRYFNTALVAPPPEPAPRERTPWKRLIPEVLAAFIVSRLLVVLVCAVYYRIQGGALNQFPQAFMGKLLPWDADHYLGIIDNWYVTEGDPRYHIVFLPFYPVVCRSVKAITGLSAFACAVFVSNAALVGCGMTLYRLTELDGDAIAARRAMLLLMFCPMTYFFSIPYSESVFLLVSLLAVLCARKRQWGWAVAFGAMAANARMLGMATAIPIFWEMLVASRRDAAEKGIEDTPAVITRRVALCVLRVLPVSVGLLLYLGINIRLYGTPTQFLVYQKENWFQSFGSMAYTFRVSCVNAFTYGDFLYRLGVWWPQTILLIVTPALLLWRRKREHVSDTAYLLVYHYVSYAPTWLLSGPRYTAAAYALYPLLARIPRRRWHFAVMLLIECVLLAYMTVVGLWRVKVY